MLPAPPYALSTRATQLVRVKTRVTLTGGGVVASGFARGSRKGKGLRSTALTFACLRAAAALTTSGSLATTSSSSQSLSTWIGLAELSTQALFVRASTCRCDAAFGERLELLKESLGDREWAFDSSDVIIRHPRPCVIPGGRILYVCCLTFEIQVELPIKA